MYRTTLFGTLSIYHTRPLNPKGAPETHLKPLTRSLEINSPKTRTTFSSRTQITSPVDTGCDEERKHRKASSPTSEWECPPLLGAVMAMGMGPRVREDTVCRRVPKPPLHVAKPTICTDHGGANPVTPQDTEDNGRIRKRRR
uniref:Uncharacterized protein n=1 Tax=Steinernema glaseri TaxID=37863 RepID=A0A1I7Z628_9BILA